MEATYLLVSILLFVFLVISMVILFKFSSANKELLEKYSEIIDIDKEVVNAKKEKSTIEDEINQLRESYKEKKLIFDKLLKEVAIFNEEIELSELGFYKFHFDFNTSEEYKKKISEVRAEQKQMISSKTAVYCNTEWTLEGSKAKGRVMTNRGIRLTARAFNNECDAGISNVRWNNITRLEQRLEKAFNAINKLNESSQIQISKKYFNLKIKELRLSHEFKEKKQKEKEEQAEIRRQMREESRLEKEMEKAFKDEEKYQKLLDKAREEADKAAGEKLNKLQEKIALLDKDLEEAREKSERAKSMAQQTKIGHVYVISNLGSFGEDVYKIGMTRRLEPMDRVKELGDASVPFAFDVHAMIHAEDAPTLENALHKSFDYKRLNLVNSRKEFFNVTLNEIKDEVMKISPDVEFIETAEARQYRESKAIRAQRELISSSQKTYEGLPQEI